MGIYGKLKKAGASVASRGSRKGEESVAASSQQSSYAPPTDVADTDVIPTTDAASIAASTENSNAASGLRSIAASGSDGSDNSKKKALLAGEDPEMGAEDDEIVENQSIISKASSFIMSAFSVNNSTIATNVSGGDLDSVHKELNEVDEDKNMAEKMMERSTICCASLLAFWYGLSKVVQVSLLAGAALGTVGVVAMVVFGGRAPAFPAHINVAFVGNSYFYVNDLPRFVENIGGGHITQDSVIHNSASILQIIMTGNGMYNKWATKKAMIGGVKFETNTGKTAYLYDMGACSVPQLLTGHDQMVTKQNGLGSFIDDGQNPCFQDDAYRQYEESFDLRAKGRGGWDFVVITDQSKVMAVDETRQETLSAFNYTYGPLLKKHNISPIIVQPHAYSSSSANSTGLSDLATFTALIMEGAQIYKKYLGKRTGLFSSAHVAPVGNTFAAIYEESRYDLYPKLFMDDGIHPSAYGTFVYGCVIYATMTGYMPKYNRVVVDDMENSDIFATARRLQATSSVAGFPTKDEAAILYKIAKKVALRGYTPKMLRGFKIESDAADFLTENNDNAAAYQGDYQSYNQYASNSGGGYYNDYYQDQAYGGGYGNNYQNNQQTNNGNYNGAYGGNDGGNDDANAQQQNGNQNNQEYEQYYYNQNGNSNYNGNYQNNGDYENGNNNGNNNYNGGDYGNDDANAQQQNNGNNQQYYYNNGN
ncbi:MAG: hypothetical protein ACI8RD_004678 [Bacillariaceae sp.]|jgi:hypothetical protein